MIITDDKRCYVRYNRGVKKKSPVFQHRTQVTATKQLLLMNDFKTIIKPPETYGKLSGGSSFTFAEI